MTLENYIDFHEKIQFQIGEKVTSPADIKNIFRQFEGFYSKKKDERLIFRGTKEASYKLYTTSQRDWILNHSDMDYSHYLGKILDNSKSCNNGIIKKYLGSIDKTFVKNNLSYFSIMQHYGLPSPLLDFTYNPFIALYFAVQNIEKCFYDDDYNNIRNFFSVYFIYPRWAKYKGFTKELLELDLQNLKSEVYQLVDYQVVYNNLNIQAQEGLFFVNTFSNEDLITSMKKTNKANENVRFGCYNIHKSLANLIKESLISKELTDSTLFPDFRMIK